MQLNMFHIQNNLPHRWISRGFNPKIKFAPWNVSFLMIIVHYNIFFHSPISNNMKLEFQPNASFVLQHISQNVTRFCFPWFCFGSKFVCCWFIYLIISNGTTAAEVTLMDMGNIGRYPPTTKTQWAKFMENSSNIHCMNYLPWNITDYFSPENG